MVETIDQIIEVDHETITDMMIGETITGKMRGEIITDRIIEETAIEVTIGKIVNVIIIENRGIEIEVQVEVGIITEVITEIIQGKDLNEVEMQTETVVEKHSYDLTMI